LEEARKAGRVQATTYSYRGRTVSEKEYQRLKSENIKKAVMERVRAEKQVRMDKESGMKEHTMDVGYRLAGTTRIVRPPVAETVVEPVRKGAEREGFVDKLKGIFKKEPPSKEPVISLEQQQRNIEARARFEEERKKGYYTRITPEGKEERVYTGVVREMKEPSSFPEKFQYRTAIKVGTISQERPTTLGGKIQHWIDVPVGAVASSVAGTVHFGSQMVKDPVGTTVGVGKGLWSGGKYIWETKGLPSKVMQEATARPIYWTAFVGAELLTAKGAGKLGKTTVKWGGRFYRKALFELDPKKVKPTGRVYDFFTVSGEKIRSAIAPTWKGISEPLTKQVKYAGKQVVATHVGRIQFFGRVFRRTKRAVSGGEQGYGMFFDPKGRLRFGRLRETSREASLSEFFQGKFTWRKQVKTPQVLVDPFAQVEKFPRYLKDVETGIKTGKIRSVRDLTPEQRIKFETWQKEYASGKYKPVGYLSTEPEITLPVGTVPVKVGTLGKVWSQWQKLPVLQITTKKPSAELQKLLTARIKTPAHQERLAKLYKQETGITYDPYSYKQPPPTAPYSSLIGGGLAFGKTPPTPSYEGMARLGITTWLPPYPSGRTTETYVDVPFKYDPVGTRTPPIKIGYEMKPISDPIIGKPPDYGRDNGYVPPPLPPDYPVPTTPPPQIPIYDVPRVPPTAVPSPFYYYQRKQKKKKKKKVPLYFGRQYKYIAGFPELTLGISGKRGKKRQYYTGFERRPFKFKIPRIL